MGLYTVLSFYSTWSRFTLNSISSTVDLDIVWMDVLRQRALLSAIGMSSCPMGIVTCAWVAVRVDALDSITVDSALTQNAHHAITIITLVIHVLKVHLSRGKCASVTLLPSILNL